jgi:hypothetical protein
MVPRPIAEARLECALEALRENDHELLVADVSEWCISGRLALYLQGVFPSHAVDIEYNRIGHDTKTLRLPEECANKRSSKGQSLVYPDIIVHRRGTGGPNALALEIKKSTSRVAQECDRQRARAYRRQLGYEHAATILITTGNHPEVGTTSVWWAD